MRAIQFNAKAAATRERRGQVASWRKLARTPSTGWTDGALFLHTFAGGLVFLMALGVV